MALVWTPLRLTMESTEGEEIGHSISLKQLINKKSVKLAKEKETQTDAVEQIITSEPTSIYSTVYSDNNGDSKKYENIQKNDGPDFCLNEFRPLPPSPESSTSAAAVLNKNGRQQLQRQIRRMKKNMDVITEEKLSENIGAQNLEQISVIKSTDSSSMEITTTQSSTVNSGRSESNQHIHSRHCCCENCLINTLDCCECVII